MIEVDPADPAFDNPTKPSGRSTGRKRRGSSPPSAAGAFSGTVTGTGASSPRRSPEAHLRDPTR